jgi:translation initiation factor 4E
MKPLCTFSTIEDFWRYFNHIPKPSEVFYDGENRKIVGPKNTKIEGYSLFKRGIEPEWSDAANKTGGEWFIRQNLELDVLDMYWQNLVMGSIGESIEDGADTSPNKKGLSVVNGARVVDKGKGYPMFRIELWMSTRDAEVKEQVRNKLVECITDGLPPSRKKGSPKFDWKDHS